MNEGASSPRRKGTHRVYSALCSDEDKQEQHKAHQTTASEVAITVPALWRPFHHVSSASPLTLVVENIEGWEGLPQRNGGGQGSMPRAEVMAGHREVSGVAVPSRLHTHKRSRIMTEPVTHSDLFFAGPQSGGCNVCPEPPLPTLFWRPASSLWVHASRRASIT